jgi:predicted mannosyl-3-phosphoglycerate phosphatase (HAD superfamily)
MEGRRIFTVTELQKGLNVEKLRSSGLNVVIQKNGYQITIPNDWNVENGGPPGRSDILYYDISNGIAKFNIRGSEKFYDFDVLMSEE